MERTINELEVSWSSEAQVQYYDVLLFWIEKTENEKFSNRIEKEVTKVLDTLKTYPKMGTLFNSKTIRRVIVLSYFSIFYKILEEQNEIEIVSFWDNRKDPERLNL